MIAHKLRRTRFGLGSESRILRRRMPAPTTSQTHLFACVACHAPMGVGDGQARCPACGASHRVIADDIPILVPEARLPQFVPDPGITFDRALAIAEDLQRTRGTWHDLIDAYYETLL